ncbi:hypothetical protein Tco_0941073 [Tanacetum coccineum]|uniref:Reverse transcriptase domain-containing protein n=1 Tax=Tanacetum coccineum TaxID=301880 RepID=A0ABQ5DRE9_9ASTR
MGITMHRFRTFIQVNTIPNPRNEVKAITTRSGLAYDGPLPPMPPPYVNPDNEDGKETEVTKDQVQPTSSQSTARVQPPVVQIKEKLSDALVQKCQICLIDQKVLLNNKDKLIEITKTPMNANCSAVILKKLPEKLGDPGPILIPLILVEFDNHCTKQSLRISMRKGECKLLVKICLKVLNDDPFSPSTPLEFKKEVKNVEKVKTSIEEPPDLELKELPSHLEYAFLEKDKNYPS